MPGAQRVSQPPQLVLSVLRSTQELPQYVCDEVHFDVHFPCEQSSEGWHDVPHDPQFAESLIVSVHAAPHVCFVEGQ